MSEEVQKFNNRDLSWLQFNERVLFQAQDASLPLLERVRFLSIFTSNLDEFFMKRLGNLKRRIDQGDLKATPDGLFPEQLSREIKNKVDELVALQNKCFNQDIIPALQAEDIYLLKWKDLTKSEQKYLTQYFRAQVFSVLTPLAVDPAHPFPFLSNLSVSLGVKLHEPKQKKMLFARIKIPDVLPQWVSVSGNYKKLPLRLVRLIDVVEHHLSELFPEMVVQRVMPFRITRSIEVEPSDDDNDDVLELVEEELRQRRLADVVRIEHTQSADSALIKMLEEELEVSTDDFYQTTGELNYRTLNEIAALALPRLKYKSWQAQVPKRLASKGSNIFNVIKRGDLLVHHPYESFAASVEHFITQAAEDPNVMAIKMTVYRTGELSPFIPILIEAALAGKQVVCVVEVKARLDEARNLYWAEKLESAGVHVVYGLVGFKTHTKLMLVVRKEQSGFRFYSHIGSGNYNTETAKVYTDLGLFTANTAISTEVVEILNYLTGLSLKRNYRHFLLAPINMRQIFLQLIANEVKNSKMKKPCGIIAKMNSLEDTEICHALYAASAAGVPIVLVIRGLCVLRAGVAGLSENIRVISIVGRFLEHSRIFYFRDGQRKADNGKIYFGSADWMYRNLNRRVETVVPIVDKKIKSQVYQWLTLMLEPRVGSWELNPKGDYLQNVDEHKRPHLQECLMEQFKA